MIDPHKYFPRPVANFVTGMADATGAPTDFGVMAVMAVGSCISKSIEVQVKTSQKERGNMFLCIIAQKGWAKSPVFKVALHAIMKKQDEATVDYEKRLVEWTELYDEEKDKEKKDAMQAVKPKMPAIYLYNKGTVEGMRKTLRDMYVTQQIPSMLIHRDELKGFFGDFNAYRQGAGSDMEAYLELFNTTTITVRNKGEQYTVPDACVSVCGTTQPEIFRKAMDVEKHENGMFDRFCYIFLEGFPPATDAKREIDQGMLDDYHAYITRALDHNGPALDGSQKLTTIFYTDAQKDRLTKVYETYYHNGSNNDTSAFKKWETNLHKLVVVLTGLWMESTVTDEILDRAIGLNNELIQHWLRTYGVQVAKEESSISTEIMSLIMRFHREKGMCKTKDLAVLRKKDHSVVKRSLDMLISAGFVKSERIGPFDMLTPLQSDIRKVEAEMRKISFKEAK